MPVCNNCRYQVKLKEKLKIICFLHPIQFNRKIYYSKKTRFSLNSLIGRVQTALFEQSGGRLQAARGRTKPWNVQIKKAPAFWDDFLGRCGYGAVHPHQDRGQSGLNLHPPIWTAGITHGADTQRPACLEQLDRFPHAPDCFHTLPYCDPLTFGQIR